FDKQNVTLIYNQAVLLYKFNRYAQVVEKLLPLFQNIEKIDEYMSMKICFLLLDTYCIQQKVDDAIHIIEYLEKEFASLFIQSPTIELSNKKNKKKNQQFQMQYLPIAETKSTLHYYRAKVNLLAQNIKQANEDIKLASTTQPITKSS